MKICPRCRTQYTDDDLRFCLQDGTALEPRFDTVSNDPETETLVRPTSRDRTHEARYEYEPDAASSRFGDSSERGSRVGMVVAMTAVGTLLLVLAGLGIWMLANRGRGTANNSHVINVDLSSNATPTPSPSPTPTVTPTPTPTPEPEPTISADQRAASSRDVKQQINEWAAAGQDGDLDRQLTKYADTVKYYNKGDANHDFIRADRERAFAAYESIEMDISDLNVAVDPTGETATATFNKEWVFDGVKRSTGKVRQELKLRKIRGEWLIVSERDTKIYYTGR